MNFEEAKRRLFEKDPQAKIEYDALGPLYELKSMIIKLRNERGWSQKDLAEKIGTQQSAISRFESGTYNPSFAFIAKLAEAFGKTINIQML